MLRNVVLTVSKGTWATCGNQFPVFPESVRKLISDIKIETYRKDINKASLLDHP